ncbi:MAG: hypothetical protein AAGE05_11450 [Pseudomonadota bacterium]
MSLFGKLFGNRDGPSPGMDILPIDPAVDTPPDPDATEQLRQLVAVPPERRDDGWAHAFFSALWTAAIEIPSSKPFIGPDGFAYLRFDMPVSHSFVAHNLASLAQPCLDAGSGAVLFPDPQAADPAYVIPMGVIESIVRYRDWRGDPVDLDEAGNGAESGNVTVKAGTRIMQGTPSADYLSREAAQALDRHLKDVWKVAEPRVSVMMSAEMQPSRSLIVNVSRNAFESDAYADNFARAVLWFLPPSRSIILMPDSMNEAEMTLLGDLAKG